MGFVVITSDLNEKSYLNFQIESYMFYNMNFGYIDVIYSKSNKWHIVNNYLTWQYHSFYRIFTDKCNLMLNYNQISIKMKVISNK